MEGPEASNSLRSLINDIFLGRIPRPELCWQVVAWSSQQQMAPEDKHKLHPRKWLNNISKTRIKLNKGTKWEM